MRVEAGKKPVALPVILGAGGLLRLFYVCFSTIYDRQYDIGMIDLDAGHTVSGGHLAYIQYLYENWRLPDFDPTTVYQFHHPPLHHFICAAWMKICSIFIADTSTLEESIQVVPFVCSLLILWFMLRLLRQLGMKDKAVCFVMALFAFHPALVLLSGSVNNDCMALLFTLMCVYYTVEWSRRPAIGNILKIALSISLGMLVKQNVAEMAFPIAAVFLYVLVCRWRQEGFPGKLAAQFAVFVAVSIPIGMSFYLRNLIRFGTDLIWVYELPSDSWQYTGNVPVINRFLWPIPSEMVDNLLHFKIGCGYNVWMQIVRTSVLGEWDMADVGRGVKLLAVFLMLFGAVLAFAALCCFVRVFVLSGGKSPAAQDVCSNGQSPVQRAEDGKEKLQVDMPVRVLYVGSYLVNMICYFVFAYRYPQECSMHFRYIEITLLFPAAALGLMLQETGCVWLRRLASAVLGCFALCSVLMIGVWCLG